MKSKKLIVIIIITVPVLIAAALLWIGAMQITQSVLAMNWPTTEGQVTDSTIMKRLNGDSKPSPVAATHYPEVEYTYSVDNHKYVSQRITFGDAFKLNPEKVVRRYPAGRRITVFYKPDNPSISVLEPGLQVESIEKLLLGLLIGIAIIFAFKKTGQRFKKTSADSKDSGH
jgi:flagellar basal body-associated protein FliL